MMEWWAKRTVLEKKTVVVLIVILIVLVLLITLSLVFAERDYCQTDSCIKASGQILSTVDVYQNACEDFYGFACGNHLNDSHQNRIQRNNINKLKHILLEPVRADDTKSLQLQKKFYQSCTNTAAIDRNNATTFLGLIAKLGGWPVVDGNNWNESAFDFVEFMVNCREIGLPDDWFLDVSVYSSAKEALILELNVPDDANKVEDLWKDKYIDLMTNVAMTLGAHSYLAKLEMRDVMFFENKLADLIENISDDINILYKNGPPVLTISEVQTTWQKINWLELLNKITKRQLDEHQKVAYFVQTYMPMLDKLLSQTRKRTQANYIVWKIVEVYAPLLPQQIRDLVADYKVLSNNKQLGRYHQRDTYCFEEAQAFFQYAVEAAYLRRHVNNQKRQQVEDMIERIQLRLEEHLQQASWMDEESKAAAISRLQNLSFIVGGPEEMYYAKQFDKYIDVDNIELNSSNIIDISTEIHRKRLDTIFTGQRQPANYLKNMFYEMVPSLETHFFEDYNLLWVPAGILQEPFYDDGRPNYLNYGTLGTTLGHEMSSSFVFNRGWSNATLRNFRNASKCFLNCTDVQVNCEENFAANMADYTGVNLSYEAYSQWLRENGREMNLPGLNLTNRQLFWLAYGSLMCHLSIIELNYVRLNDVMPQAIIIGSFRNSPHFSRDFVCELGSNMNPRQKCQIL